jgi:hypothetical protein
METFVATVARPRHRIAMLVVLGAFLSPLAGLGGQGAATVAGIMLAALCVAGLPCVLLIAKTHPETTPKS